MTRFSDRGVDEICTYSFRFPSGCFAQIATSFNLLMKNEAIIYGSEGYVTFPNFLTGDRYTLHRHNGKREVEEVLEIISPQHENGFVYQVEEVARCIRKGLTESPIIPLSATIATMEVMDQMRMEWGLEYPFEKKIPKQ
jgi:predicted dehydrogenase